MPPIRELTARRDASLQFRKVASALRAIAAANLGFAERVRVAAEDYERRVEEALSSVFGRSEIRTSAHTIIAFVAEGGFCGMIDDSVFQRLRQLQSAESRTILVGRRGARRARDSSLSFSESMPMAAHISDFDERIAAVTARIESDETILLIAPRIHAGAHSVIERVVSPRKFLDPRAPIPLTNQPVADLMRALNRERIHAAVALSVAECFSAENMVRFRLMDSACRQTDETTAALTMAINHTRDAQISEDIFEIFMAENTTASDAQSAQ